MTDLPGIEVESVSAWFEGNVDGARPPLQFELIAGGRSNLTYKVTDSAGSYFVLRRPPTSHVLATAHDMGREHKIISGLAETPVPVAPALGFCEDAQVTGAPFYVMGFVEGHILRDAGTTAKVLDEEARRTAGEDLVDVMVHIHGVDVDAVGLGDLGRREGYIARQLKRWHGQFDQSKTRELPMMDELHRFLDERTPPQQGATIVHGDYRLDNTMLGEDGRVRAVLDWEICTLGDPLADLGILNVYWTDPDDDGAALGASATGLPGFPRKKELVARYAERSGRDVSSLDFYIAFGYWKLACILEGVFARYSGGAMGGDRSNFTGMGAQVERLARQAEAAASRL